MLAVIRMLGISKWLRRVGRGGAPLLLRRLFLWITLDSTIDSSGACPQIFGEESHGVPVATHFPSSSSFHLAYSRSASELPQPPIVVIVVVGEKGEAMWHGCLGVFGVYL